MCISSTLESYNIKIFERNGWVLKFLDGYFCANLVGDGKIIFFSLSKKKNANPVITEMKNALTKH
jgi:hypothetical protein